MRVVGNGVVKYWTGTHWAVNDGLCDVYIYPENFIGCRPEVGLEGVLTYEFNPQTRSTSCVNCFRRAGDPLPTGTEG